MFFYFKLLNWKFIANSSTTKNCMMLNYVCTNLRTLNSDEISQRKQEQHSVGNFKVISSLNLEWHNCITKEQISIFILAFVKNKGWTFFDNISNQWISQICNCGTIKGFNNFDFSDNTSFFHRSTVSFLHAPFACTFYHMTCILVTLQTVLHKSIGLMAA